MEIKELLEKLNPRMSTSVQLMKELDPKIGTIAKLVVEQRMVNPEPPAPPVRRESPSRKHNFYDVHSFVAYLSDYGRETTVVFANPETGNMSAVLDEASSDGYEVVSCQPMLHPLWKPWESVCGKTVSLDTFVQFLLQNRRVVENGRALVLELSQITATTTVELQRGRGKNAINGLMVRTKIQGQEATNMVELPDTITIECPIYIKTKPQKITLDLTISVSSDGGSVGVTLSSGDLLAAKIAAIDEMFECMSPLRDQEMTITMGAPGYGEWEYLPQNIPVLDQKIGMVR